jgi:hypothetical protein
VGYLGSILFRDDELVLCLFDAPVVRRAHDQEHLLVPHRVQLLECAATISPSGWLTSVARGFSAISLRTIAGLVSA